MSSVSRWKYSAAPLALNLTGHLLAPLRVRGETQAPPTFGYLSATIILRLPTK